VSGLPAYDELPVDPSAPPGSSWGLWPDPELGALNLLTPETVARAAGCIRTGRRFALDVPLDAIDPPLFDRPPLQHEVITYPSTAQDDVIREWNTQASSQWDGFRHQRHAVHGYYGGLAQDQHGTGHWARQGIVGRGVVVDVAGRRAATGRGMAHDTRDEIDAAELTDCLDAQGVEVRPGDILLIATGWLGWYRTLSARRRAEFPPASSFVTSGLAADESMARLLWELHVSAVAADNPALEAYPRHQGQFLHNHLLNLLGIPIGELWDLGELVADCRAAGSWDCFLVSAPMGLRGGAGSPANAIAIR
jgi:kynurenine formamidase